MGIHAQRGGHSRGAGFLQGGIGASRCTGPARPSMFYSPRGGDPRSLQFQRCLACGPGKTGPRRSGGWYGHFADATRHPSMVAIGWIRSDGDSPLIKKWASALRRSPNVLLLCGAYGVCGTTMVKFTDWLRLAVPDLDVLPSEKVMPSLSEMAYVPGGESSSTVFTVNVWSPGRRFLRRN